MTLLQPAPAACEAEVVYSPSPWRQGPSSPMARAGSELCHAPVSLARGSEEGNIAKVGSDLRAGYPYNQLLQQI